MPKVTEKVSRAAYNALVNIVGPEWVTDDAAITESYVKGGEIHDCIYQRGQQPPGVVVMPKNTEEVQRIVKVCFRYHLPYTPIGAFWGVHCGGKVPFHVSIDLSRMRGLDWDERHMAAIVEPGLIHSPLQAEAQERGLYTMTPGGGSQAAVIGNMLTCNYSPLNYRLGLATRRILGVEWVLPDGEVIRLGSLSNSDDPFWGEGPGPDLRGLLRGYLGWWGKVGIITKMAIKMHPLFLPERMKPVERGMLSTLEFPDNRIKWYNFRMPSEEAMRKAMREISRCEIGAAVMRVPTIWRYRGKSTSREDFWDKWGPDEKKIRESRATSSILRVLLIGYTGPKQLEYEEGILMQIMDELGGTLGRTKQSDQSWIKNADSAGMWWPAGGYVSVEFVVETLEHSFARGKTLLKEKESKFTPPLVDEYGEEGWIQMTDMGHTSYFEFLIQWDPEHPMGKYKSGEYKAWEHWVASQRTAIDHGQYTANIGSLSVMGLTGPAFGPNYGEIYDKVRQAVDPKDISNPPLDLHDRVIEEFAPKWMEEYDFQPWTQLMHGGEEWWKVLTSRGYKWRDCLPEWYWDRDDKEIG
jgi:hypothetical protein